MNGHSVGLGPAKRILGWPSARLMGISVRIGFGTPKLGGVGTCIALPGSQGEKTHFRHRLGGGG